MVHVVGEISTTCYVDIPHIVRETIRDIGYTRAKYGFDCDTCGVLVSLDEQSPDIAMGVDDALEKKEGNTDKFDTIGAGDQGMMFGYATNETDDYMPLPISLAHRLARRLAKVRKDGTLPYLRPDGKTQVTVEYEDGKQVRIDTIVISAQHSPEVGREQIESDLLEFVIKPELPEGLFDDKTKLFINPTGRFVIGGPQGDSGLTGRKIIVGWTLAAAWLVTAAVLLRQGTPQKSTDRPLMQPVTSPRTSSLPAWPINAKSSWPAPSAASARFPSTSKPSVRAKSRTKRSSNSSKELRPSSGWHHRRASTCSARSTNRPGRLADTPGRNDHDRSREKTDKSRNARQNRAYL